MQNRDKNTQVLIVGAGPSGLMMACQLALRNISFRIIDKKEHPANYSGALILQPRSLEIFDQMGLAEKAIGQGIEAHKINIVFNKKKAISLNIKNIGKGLTKFPNLLMLEQSKTEQLLIDYITGYGLFVERKTELCKLLQVDDGVISTLKLPDGTEETIKSSFLIAADGGQSLIRKQLNIPFIGKTRDLSLFVLDGKAELNLPSNEIFFSFSKDINSGIFPLKGERWRIDGTIPKELETVKELTFMDFEEKFAKHNKLNLGQIQPEWFSVFHSHQKFAESFRQNRCFLVGDAAHVFSPIGAQGMNAGLQDAYNLAWKLSLVIEGKARDSLLETYPTERQTIAKKLVYNTDSAFQWVTSENFFAKNFRLWIAPVLLKLIFPMIEKRKPIRHFIFKGISEIGINYRRSAVLKETSIGYFLKKSPKPGDRLPYVVFSGNENEVNIQDRLKDGKFHLIIFANHSATFPFDTIVEKYNDMISIENIPFSRGTEILYRSFGIKKVGFYLIRPDMHIAYRSNKSGIDHFEKFLKNFFL